MNAGRINIDGMLFPLQKFAMVTSKSVTKNIVIATIVAFRMFLPFFLNIYFFTVMPAIPSHHKFILVAVTVVTGSYRDKFL